LSDYYNEIKKLKSEVLLLKINTQNNLKEFECQIDLEKKIIILPENISKYLKEYQINVLFKIFKHIFNDNNILISWIMGSGKTIITFILLKILIYKFKQEKNSENINQRF
jgi:type I site-specific restriction endonuclease